MSLSKFKLFLFVNILSALIFSSCSKYQKLLKSTDYEKKYDAAVNYYNDKDYYKAQPLLEELVSIYRGTKKAEKIYYYYAYCHYGQGEYELASYHFDNFVKTFSNSELAEECMYMKAYCYYINSPTASLDQTNTYKAINEMQLFVNLYPKSTRVKECNELMDGLRNKLETKNFDNAKLYYNMEDYKSAVYAFKNVLKDFPDTKYREEILFLIMKANYLYANNSIETKKSERYHAAIDAHNVLIETYPKTKYLKDAENIFDNALKQIEKLKSITHS